MYTNCREDEVNLIKGLWDSQPTTCPRCGNATLEYLHKKAKRSDCDWKCPSCGEIYRTVKMLKELPNE